MKFLIHNLFLWILLLGLELSFSGEIGVVIKTRGQSMVMNQDASQWKELAPGDILYSDDILQTSINGWIVTKYLDNELALIIHPSSELVLWGDFEEKGLEKFVRVNYGNLVAQINSQDSLTEILTTATIIKGTRSRLFITHDQGKQETTIMTMKGNTKILNNARGLWQPVKEGVKVICNGKELDSIQIEPADVEAIDLFQKLVEGTGSGF